MTRQSSSTDTSTSAGTVPDGVSTDRPTRRTRPLIIWTVAFVVGWLGIGLPTDPLYAFLWLWAFAVAYRWGQPWRVHRKFAQDWLPVVLLLALYNFSRGFADNGATPHVVEMIHADLWMFGAVTGGLLPTVWLQQHLYDPAGVHWWDIAGSWVYFSHFVAALGAAVILWLRARRRWAAFMRRWFVLTLAGLVTYFVYPAAPPWWAALHGEIPQAVARISTRGWRAFGMHGAGNLLNLGQQQSNPIAAIPSLHTAFALFVVVFFLPAVRRRWWPLLLLYPLAMTFTLVYSGEHYVVDVLVGWAYVGATFLVVGLAERWWRTRRAARAGGHDAIGPPPSLVGAAEGHTPPVAAVESGGPSANVADGAAAPTGH